VKLSLLSQYLRILDPTSRLRRVTWALIVICALWGTSYAFIAMFPCFPISAEWTRDGGYCYGFGSQVPHALAGTFLSHTSTNVVLDLAVLAIPVPLYFQKDTTLRQRLGIGALLMLGVAYVSSLC
jgi:hypothetical protein